ncbi:MAG: DUF3524 domain-containing protein [Planctomycetota bacterium]|nr:DUF3524 domain-containing protein [Planctomycetota bacterium]
MAADRSRRILAFEPYDGGSHRAVRESISRHSRHEWRWLTRPARAWKWRMRLGALELLEQAAGAGELERPIEAIFATSLLSLADLIAGLPPALRGTPAILYMHENQIAYPRGDEHRGEEAGRRARTAGDSEDAHSGAGVGSCGGEGSGDRSCVDVDSGADTSGGGRDVHFALTNLTSILAADRVIFNSDWNRRSFIEGIEAVLRHAPDGRLKDVARRVSDRSEVIWPPVEPPPPETRRSDVLRSKGPFAEGGPAVPLAGHDRGSEGRRRGEGEVLHKPNRVVWPHRWEHDKGPAELLKLADRYTEALDLRWTILGEQFRRQPAGFAEFRRRWADRIDHMGYEPDRAAYWGHLRRGDWVLSTARHEFFGIAVVEALLAGCLPWLPDRLSYPELLPPSARGLTPLEPPSDGERVRAAIAAHLEPALAPNAVARLDDAIERTVRS